MLNSIKISVITIIYNSKDYIRQTIRSVEKQTYNNIEYIIVDGGSTDGTLEIIRDNTKIISKWVSEPDNGIADAMNKGVQLATGDYIFFLHSDDYFFSDTVIDDFVRLQARKDIEIFANKIVFQRADQSEKEMAPRGYGKWLNFKNGFHHQGTFCKKSVFDKIGLFDINLSIAMDYDFFLRAYRRGISYEKGNIIVSVMRDTGISSRIDWLTLSKRFYEERQVHKKNCNSFPLALLYRLFWYTYYPYRSLKRILG